MGRYTQKCRPSEERYFRTGPCFVMNSKGYTDFSVVEELVSGLPSLPEFDTASDV